MTMLAAEMSITIVDPDDGPLTRTVAFGIPDEVTFLTEISLQKDGPAQFKLTIGGVDGEDEKEAVQKVAALLALMADSTGQYAATL